MKVLHVPFCFYPDPAGGTEVYVAGLARWQKRQGIEVAVAAPAPQPSNYGFGSLSVHRFETGQPNLRELYGEGDTAAAASFERVLDQVSPDLVHLHAFTSAISLRLVRAARQRGLPVVFTYHTPTATCIRGTLLRNGAEVCDGVLETTRCAACVLDGRGVNRLASSALSRLPVALGRAIGSSGWSGGVWTALRMTELVELRHHTVRAMFAEVDRIVAVCEWVRDLLIRNGVDARKITLSRQGLSEEPVGRPDISGKTENRVIRIAFLGRMSRVKGLDVLVDAVLASPELAVELDIYGVVQDQEGVSLKDQLRAAAAGDARIRFFPAIPANEILTVLERYDALAIPSQWLETGPLVVYEAFAAKVPVIGSRLGGLMELVTHERDGLLVESASRQAWTAALERLVREPRLLKRLREGIGPVRTMQQAAAEMIELYAKLPAKRIAAEQPA
jgi:glycosyltransferase involved in cell wall biosynthesis